MKMKNDDFFIMSLFEQANALYLKNNDGTSRVFTSRVTLYVAAMKLIYQYSAVMYIDLVYVISEMYNMKGSLALSVYNKHLKPLGLKQMMVVRMDDKEAKSYYRDIIRGLHSYCGTHFDTYAFDSAFNEFSAHVAIKELFKKNKDEQHTQSST